MPDVVTPSAFSPKTVEAKPVAPVAPIPAAVPVKSPETISLEADRAKLADERRMLEIRMQRNQKKYAEDAKAKEAKFAEREAKLTQYEKERSTAKLNKSAYLKSLYGDDWYDQVISEKLNGGAPTGDVVAGEVAKLREEFEAKLAARDEEAKKQSESQRTASVDNARRQLTAEAGGFWKAKGVEYPLVDGLGTPEEIASEIARRVESHYLRTTQRDEDGRILTDGQILPLHKAAELWEADLVKLAERAAGHEKYAAKFAPKPQTSAVQPRRTLSNDLTGSTPGQRPPPANNEEKRARADAAYLAARKPSP